MKSVVMLSRPGTLSDIRDRLARRFPAAAGSLLCGFLLCRGLLGGAQGAQWSMAAVTGSGCSVIYGVMLFTVAGAVVGTVREGFEAKANTMLDWVVYAAYLLCQIAMKPEMALTTALIDSTAVGCALWAAKGRPAGWKQAAGMLVLLIVSLFAPLPESEHTLMRLSVLCEVLGSAGLFGSAAYRIARRYEETDWRWLLIGAAAGILKFY